MRKIDAWGQPIPRVGDVVASLALDSDPGTVVKVLQVNANGPYVVAVKWFTWDGGRTEERQGHNHHLQPQARDSKVCARGCGFRHRHAEWESCTQPNSQALLCKSPEELA